VELGIVQLGDVLDALLDVRIELGIPFLQENEVVLVDDPHVDAFEELHVVEILQAADAQHRQDADAVGPQIVHHIADVLGEPRAGAGQPGDHDGDRNVVGLPLLLLITQRSLLGLSGSRQRRQREAQAEDR
jgi:hypothetical protein